MSVASGWFLATTADPPLWPFTAYYLALVAAFCLILWASSNRAGRRDLARTSWLIGLLALLPLLSYLGDHGPLQGPVLHEPVTTLAVCLLALAAYYTAVVVGRKDAKLTGLERGDSGAEIVPDDGQASGPLLAYDVVQAPGDRA